MRARGRMVRDLIASKRLVGKSAEDAFDLLGPGYTGNGTGGQVYKVDIGWRGVTYNVSAFVRYKGDNLIEELYLYDRFGHEPGVVSWMSCLWEGLLRQLAI